jgi:5-methylthioadenosine/S-adenosylhomocysteine deaminase
VKDSKHTFDILIKNGIVLTMDPSRNVFQPGFVAVSGKQIADLGEMSGVVPAARHIIDAQGGIVMPGLINSHTHSPMTLFRGLADDLPLLEWLNNYIFPVERKMDKEFVRTGALLGCAEMILSGTTTFCDMYLFEEEVALSAKEAGMRCLAGEVLYDFPSPCYGDPKNALPHTESFIKRWLGDELISPAVMPHSLFTCSPELLRASLELAERYNVPLKVHVAETLDEVKQIKKLFGKNPIQYLSSLGLLNERLIAVHCVHVDKDDIAMMAEAGVRAVHAPESNMKLASGVAPVPEMIKAGLTVGLGTDGCASNNNLDLIGEMDMAAKLHKAVQMDPTLMDALTVISMATDTGARTLGIGHLTGSLEIGKRADIIIIDVNRPHLTPMYNPYSHLVYAARGSDVICSIINGRLVMEERRLLTLDLPCLLEEAEKKANDVRAWIGYRG